MGRGWASHSLPERALCTCWDEETAWGPGLKASQSHLPSLCRPWLPCDVPEPAQLAARWWGPSLLSEADEQGSLSAPHPQVFALLTTKHWHTDCGDSNSQTWHIRATSGEYQALGQLLEASQAAEMESPLPNPSYSRSEGDNKQTKWNLKSWLL